MKAYGDGPRVVAEGRALGPDEIVGRGRPAATGRAVARIERSDDFAERFVDTQAFEEGGVEAAVRARDEQIRTAMVARADAADAVHLHTEAAALRAFAATLESPFRKGNVGS